MFQTIDHNNKGFITKGQIFQLLEKRGLNTTDPHIQSIFGFLNRRAKDTKIQTKINPEKITEKDFNTIIKNHENFINKIAEDTLIIPNFHKFSAQIEAIFKKTAKNKTGKVATYIPQLAQIDPDQFALSLCTIDGQRLNLGDYNTHYCAQSTSKPINYAIALELHGTKKVHQHIGREPSGKSFNEITLNKAMLPHNPMINAGAIISAALIHPNKPISERFDTIMKTWEQLSGGQKPGYNNAIYNSEKDTADRNFAIAHFMREVGAFPPNSDMKDALDIYFQSCSIELTSHNMASVAATLANGGICPLTNTKIFNLETVKNCLSLMYSCGMYDFSGEFAFTVGLPAKSGVSGALMVVIPGVMGIALWSPRLDSIGNSARGIEFCNRLIEKFKFHNYDNMMIEETGRTDPRHK